MKSSDESGRTEDCLACRLVGSASLIGAGAFIIFRGHRELHSAGPTSNLRPISQKRLGLGLFGTAFILGGLYRLFQRNSDKRTEKS